MFDSATSIYRKPHSVGGRGERVLWPMSFTRFEGCFGAAFLGLFALFYLLGMQQFFPWAVLILDVFCLALRKPSLPILYTAFLVGNEAASALIVVVWLIGASNVRLGRIKDVKLDKEILLICLVILVVSFAQSWRAGTIANTAISATYLCFIALLAYACSQAVGYGSMLRCTCLFIVVEFAASLIICAKVGVAPGDAHYGTLSNAHFFGIFCLLACVVVFRAWRAGDIRQTRAAMLFMMLVFMMWAADAKSALGAGLICLVCFLLLRTIKTGSTTIVTFLWVITCVFLAGSLLMSLPEARNVLTGEGFPLSSFFKTYVYDDGYQNKFDYFMGTASQMTSDGHILYGYGLGTYGSRFANMLGYTYTYRDPSAFNQFAAALFPSRMIPEYIPFASAYNEQLHSIIQWFSAVLTYPFSSFVALIGETGLLGVAALGLILRKLRLDGTAQVLVAIFIGFCITDLYFDRIQTLGLLIMLCAAFNQMESERDSRGHSLAKSEGRQ